MMMTIMVLLCLSNRAPAYKIGVKCIDSVDDDDDDLERLLTQLCILLLWLLLLKFMVIILMSMMSMMSIMIIMILSLTINDLLNCFFERSSATLEESIASHAGGLHYCDSHTNLPPLPSSNNFRTWPPLLLVRRGGEREGERRRLKGAYFPN